MEYQPTPEQQQIINESSNCVVIAKPGTGKTTTLAYKIRNILPLLPYYRGIIAISFTNKASLELEHRSLSTGIDRKNSFFGTIDKFFLMEVIFPFGERIFGKPQSDLEIVRLNSVDISNYGEFNSEKSFDESIDFYKNLFQDGKVPLEIIGSLAIHVLEKSNACRRYLQARFSHIIVDEYQDCDLKQHELFLTMVGLGLVGIAVGDIDQSIFAFAKKSSKYLSALARDTRTFITFSLSTNHRSHLSIVNYATKLLSNTYLPKPVEEICVYEKCIDGSEIEIAQWISKTIAVFETKLKIPFRRNVGILFKSRRAGNLIYNNLSIPSKPIIDTPLDNDSSIWGAIFRNILYWVYSSEITKFDLVEQYLSIDYQRKTVCSALKILLTLEEIVKSGNEILEGRHCFEQLSLLLSPNARNNTSLLNLDTILSDSTLLSSFVPANDEEVQLLTLHKAKGLEFDLVLHLDLYEWILPQYNGDRIQDLNLHYVGITRARKACVLCTSTKRHNSNGEIVDANYSEFLLQNGLESLRRKI